MAEIGVWEGDLTEEILCGNNVSFYLAVDPWEYRPDRVGAWYGSGSNENQASMEARYERCLCRLEKWLSSGTLKIERARSTSVQTNRYFDLVYIDGDHTRTQVREDIEYWIRKLTKNGVLVLDDFGVEGWWENGVTHAANDFLSSSSSFELHVEGSQAIFRRKRHFYDPQLRHEEI